MALKILSLRGGLNNSDPPTEIADDQCTVATNVEFLRSTCGERRFGSESLDLSGTPFATGYKDVVWMTEHLPDGDPANSQLWIALLNNAGTAVLLAYFDDSDNAWHTPTVPDPIVCDGVSEYRIDGVSLHGKLFLFYNSGEDFLHVYDPVYSTSALRRVGMETLSTAPTAVDTAVGGTYGTTRYFRTRETVQVSGTTILRSEPSDALTFTPNGSFDGAIVTKSATVNTNPAATHWELEASLDGANFYVIATTVIGTPTATDTTLAAAGYAQTFPLAPNSGDYTRPYSARHGLVDDNRLVIFGSYEDADKESLVAWTPPDSVEGAGNDERIPLDPSGDGRGVSTLNLDNFHDGAFTDCGVGPDGLWAFKYGRGYKLVRTNQAAKAYNADLASPERGAAEGSVCVGVDAQGNPALFFADPATGPHLIGLSGIQQCGRDIEGSWKDAFVSASSPLCRAVYVPRSNQYRMVFNHIETITNVDNTGVIEIETTQKMLVSQVNEMRPTPSGWRRGWSIWTYPFAISAMCMCKEYVTFQSSPLTLRRKLFMGVGGDVDSIAAVWRTDVEAAILDAGNDFDAQIRTKAFLATNLEKQFEIKSSMLVAKAVTGASLKISAVPNFGATTTKLAGTVVCTPAGSETHVVKYQDDLSIAELDAVQIDFSDVDAPAGRWELSRFTAVTAEGQKR